MSVSEKKGERVRHTTERTGKGTMMYLALRLADSYCQLSWVKKRQRAWQDGSLSGGVCCPASGLEFDSWSPDGRENDSCRFSSNSVYERKGMHVHVHTTHSKNK